MNNGNSWNRLQRYGTHLLLAAFSAAALAESPTAALQSSASMTGGGGAAAMAASSARAGWRQVQVIEDGSPEAPSQSHKVSVTLPDKSKARVVVSGQGEPKALLLSESNEIADTRQRALEAGAAINGDQSLTLPVTTSAGSQLDFVIQQDGTAMVPDSQRVASAK